MFRTISRNVRKNLRDVTRMGGMVRPISSRAIVVRQGSTQIRRPLVKQFTLSNRGIFTTASLYGDLKKFECPNFPESISEGGMMYVKQIGDTVAVDETVCEIETQKTSLPVNSDVAGVLKEYSVEDGADVTPGKVLFVIEVGGGAAAAPPPSAPTPVKAPAAKTPASAPSSDLKDFECPPFPESISEGSMMYVKQIGDAIAVDETVCEIETQKTSLPVNSDVAGILKEYIVNDGDDVEPGKLLFRIEVGGAPAVEKPAAAPPPPGSTQFPPPQPMAAAPAPRAAPPPAPGAAPPPPPVIQPEFAPPDFGPGPARTERRVRMNRMRQTIATRLKDAQNTYAMLTTFNEVDMSAIFEMRKLYQDAFTKKHGVKLGFMSSFLCGAATALKEIPAANAVIDGTEIVYRDYVDISVAVATPRGLVVPVIRNVDRMTMGDAERALADLGARARNNAITLEDMDGGTFTISNGGVFGSMFGTPIINPPQAAILGMHNIVERAVVVRDPGAPASAPPRIEPRPMMYLALTYDHRLIDGREAVTFLRTVKAIVEDPRRLLLNVFV